MPDHLLALLAYQRHEGAAEQASEERQPADPLDREASYSPPVRQAQNA
jgi:hypothetical protein